ncbi:unnamed protein product [Psylliodes chrysocephalus]|uniref:Uncharacterized protein n=1 Tax=Psylliodes chrysocephalus TaxID=3402493 RepID=A0A9P0D711_9CUCU|nr:unnamed protein product [Psylliodes chrysocephala]
MIDESTPDELCKSLCCENDILDVKCLARMCPLCKDKELRIVEFENAENVVFERWTVQKHKLMIRGKEKICKKTIKEKVYTTKEILLQTLKSSIKDFLLHVRNIQHQYGVIKQLKNNLGTDEVLIHMDFSENYSCKYAEEVQSAHFRGSKLQLSLHTVVTYHKSDIDRQVTTNCFCTASKNLRHDKVAICAHLMPVIDKLKES